MSKPLLILLVLGWFAVPGWAQTEDRKAVLQFGIESEVLDLVRSLRQEKDLEFRDLLITTYDHAQTA